MTEEKAPSDRLYETGCVLCGTTEPVSNFGQLAVRSGGPHKGSAYCSEHRADFGGTDGIDAEITRRKSLRPSQPSDERDGPYVPKPGERVTVTAIKPGFTTDIWQVGATIEVSRAVLQGDGWVRVTGTIDGVSMACENDCHVEAEEATLPPCQHRNVNLYTMRCDDCGMTAAQVRAKAEKVAERVDPPAAKLDPDGRYPHKGFPSALDLENHAVARDRDIAAIKQHLADFDRGKAERLRNTRHWPSHDSGAGWED